MNYDLIIIGGGPAAISAGIYAARQKIKVLLIAKDFGGQIAKKSVSIGNYLGFEEISGSELIQKFEKHLKKQEIEIKMDEISLLNKKENLFLIETKNGKKFQSKSVIIASGGEPKQLDIPGEKEFIGRGVSYCALCDAPFFSGKTVAVIGGGNAGFETAIALANWAKNIYILEFGSILRAEKVNQILAEKTGKVQIITNVVLKKISGDKFVKSIIYEDTETKKEKELEVEGVFVEIGSKPTVSFLKNLVDFNEKNEIVINKDNNQTKIPGLFAAGDVTDCQYKQIIIAAGEGAKAAISAYNYLQSLKE